jgi:hypothetical protein
MQAVVDAWQPDVILRETAEFASYVVAEGTGTPHVQVAIAVAAVETWVYSLIDESLRQLGSTQGASGLMAAPRFTSVPASLEDPGHPGSAQTSRFRASQPVRTTTTLPQDWWRAAEGSLAASQ